MFLLLPPALEVDGLDALLLLREADLDLFLLHGVSSWFFGGDSPLQQHVPKDSSILRVPVFLIERYPGLGFAFHTTFSS